MVWSSTCRSPSSSSYGYEYIGTISQTYTGKTCQAWTAQTPHVNPYKYMPYLFHDGSATNAQNYCRNPGQDKAHPWCYTTDPNTAWEYCDVPYCTSGKIDI